MLKDVILVDSTGDLDACKDRIHQISKQTGVPVLKHKRAGMDSLNTAIAGNLFFIRPGTTRPTVRCNCQHHYKRKNWKSASVMIEHYPDVEWR